MYGKQYVYGFYALAHTSRCLSPGDRRQPPLSLLHRHLRVLVAMSVLSHSFGGGHLFMLHMGLWFHGLARCIFFVLELLLALGNRQEPSLSLRLQIGIYT